MSTSAYRSPARDLGSVEEVYESKSSASPVVLVTAFFVLPGLALVTGFQSAPGEVFAGDRFTNGVIGIALLAAAIVFIVMIVRKAKLRVVVHHNGLSWSEGGKTRAIFWPEIASIRGAHTSRRVAGVEASRSNVYTFALESGPPLVATSMLADVQDLAARVEAKLHDRLYAAAKNRLDAGEEVRFGPLLFDAKQIAADGRSILLADIAKAHVEEGHIRIEPKSGRAIDVEWSAVPNAKIFLELLKSKL